MSVKSEKDNGISLSLSGEELESLAKKLKDVYSKEEIQNLNTKTSEETKATIEDELSPRLDDIESAIADILGGREE